MKGNANNLRGFTLLEILISVGILAIVATLIAQVLFTTTHVNEKTEIQSDIKEDGNFALDVMARTVRGSVAVETSCSLGATSTPSAAIRNPDNKVTVFTCLSDGVTARIASVSASQTAYLTGTTVTVSTSGGTDCTDSSLSFSCPPVSGGVQNKVTVQFTLRQIGSSGNTYRRASAKFQSTVGLRN